MGRTVNKNSKGHNWIEITGKRIVQGKELYISVICSKCKLTGKKFFPSVLTTIDNEKFIKKSKLKCNGKNKREKTKKKTRRTK